MKSKGEVQAEIHKQTNEVLSQKIKFHLLQNLAFSAEEIAQACNLNRQFITDFKPWKSRTIMLTKSRTFSRLFYLKAEAY
jgi:hypothetical protein